MTKEDLHSMAVALRAYEEAFVIEQEKSAAFLAELEQEDPQEARVIGKLQHDATHIRAQRIQELRTLLLLLDSGVYILDQRVLRHARREVQLLRKSVKMGGQIEAWRQRWWAGRSRR